MSFARSTFYLIINVLVRLVFEDNTQPKNDQSDICLSPIRDGDLPLLIEEYHQLCRVVFLHRLEDVREAVNRLVNSFIETKLFSTEGGRKRRCRHRLERRFGRIIHRYSGSIPCFVQHLSSLGVIHVS